MTTVHRDLPFSAYLDLCGTNNSALSALATSPRLYRDRHPDVCDRCGLDCLGEPVLDPLGARRCPSCTAALACNLRPDTAGMALGRAAHSYILEPDLATIDYVVYDGPTSGKGSRTARKEFDAAAVLEGKVVLSAAAHAACLAMRRAVYADPVALRRIAQLTEHELSVQFEHHSGEQCKARLDGLAAGEFVLDLKTTGLDSHRRFFAAGNRLGYHCQGALYQDAAAAITGERLPYVMLAVQSVAPWDVVVYPVPNAVLQVGRDIQDERIALLHQCRVERSWPGIAGGQEVTYELPAYADPAAEDDLICEGDA